MYGLLHGAFPLRGKRRILYGVFGLELYVANPLKKIISHYVNQYQYHLHCHDSTK